MELREFDIEYLLRTAMKGRPLADFLLEFANFPKKELLERSTWVVNVDGSATKKHSGAWGVLVTLRGEELGYVVRMDFKTTNNEAEYEAVIVGLDLAKKLEAKNVEIRTNSQVIAS